MAFHIFHISEAYSSADGSVQFIEFHGDANGQNVWAGHTLTVTQGGITHTLNITQNLPGSLTNDRHVLVATQAFADLTGLTPDYIIPENFLFTTPGTQTVDFPGMDSLVIPVLPTNGLQSVGESGAAQANSPTNFDGDSISIGSALAPYLADDLDDVLAGNADAFELIVPAGAFVDITGDALSYSATLANDDPLPAWLTFDSGTRTFSFAAGTGVVGTISVKVTASDTVPGSASDVFDLTVISGDVVTGTGGPDSLSGTPDDDSISGLGGNDTIDSGGGIDTISGGAGTDTLRSPTTATLPADVENLVLTGADDIDGTGNALANQLTGNSGDNDLDGLGGADLMTGGDGDDSYVFDHLGDAASEAFNEGTDLVLASVSASLADNLENLTLAAGIANLNATGNALANVLTGNDGNNILDGGEGADAMSGGAGNDIYHVDDPGDTASDGGGVDRVVSSVSFTLGEGVENLTLSLDGAINGTGNELANIIRGNAAANLIDGGEGSDTLSGGNGADVFRFSDLSGADRVTDFRSGIDEVQLDNAAFTALIEGALPPDSAYVTFSADTGELFYDADGAGGGGPYLIALFAGSCAGSVGELDPALDIVVI